MSYVHPDDRNLTNLHKAMGYNESGQPIVRTSITNGTDNPIPVSLGGNDVVITGNVTIPGTVNVTSSPGDPVHVHVTEIGTTGILDVPWMPVSGNVTIDSGNIWINGGQISASQSGTWTVRLGNAVTQGTTPWVVTGNTNAIVSGSVTATQGESPYIINGNVNAAITSAPPVVGNVNAVVTSGNITVQQGTSPWVTDATIVGDISVGRLPEPAVTAFEEPLAVQITPVLQADGVYGLDPDFWTTTELNGGNISTTESSVWQVNSGTSPGGYARLATNRYMTYQPGQGSMFRWTAAFTTTGIGTTRDAYGVDNMVQNTGPVDREDGYSFGFSGSTASNAQRKMGILHRRGGNAELRQLTITTYPTGNQTATITLNSVAYTVNLTASTSNAYTASQIATLLKANAVVENTWDIQSCGDSVQFSYYSPGAKSGTYSFSSTGSGTIAVGSFSQLTAGTTPTDVWTYVDSWDNQTIQFDPSKLNVFAVDFRWLGAGKVRFFMENPTTGNMELVHTQIWSSQQLVPHVVKPSLRLIYRAGTTTGATPSQNVIVYGASVFAGIQGIVTQTGSSQGWYHTDTTSRAKDTVWHLMSLQNSFVRNQRIINKASLIMQNLTVSVQGQDPSLIYLVKNAKGISDQLVYSPIPIANQFVFAQYSTSLVSENLTIDTIANIQSLGINGNSSFDLMAYNLVLSPGESVSVFISSSGAITKSTIGLTWKVD